MYSERWRLVEPLPNEGPWGQMGQVSNPLDTLKMMAKNVRRAVRNRRVVELAGAIVCEVPGRDYVGALCALDAFVSERFKFLRDPFGQELLRRPEYLLQRIQAQGGVQGDCDDVAQLVATLGMAIGFPAEFCAVSFDPAGQHLSHVFTVLRLPSGVPVQFDVTRPAKYKNCPPPFTNGLTYRV
jgi:hypothetical protein